MKWCKETLDSIQVHLFWNTTSLVLTKVGFIHMNLKLNKNRLFECLRMKQNQQKLLVVEVLLKNGLLCRKLDLGNYSFG